MTKESAAKKRERVREAVCHVLETHYDKSLFAPKSRPWDHDKLRIASDSAKTALRDTNQSARVDPLAAATSYALAKLYNLECRYKHEDLRAAFEMEGDGEAVASEPAHRHSPIRAVVFSISAIYEYITFPVKYQIDRILVLFLPRAYRRQLQADTARTIASICANPSPKNSLLLASLAAEVWNAASALPDRERVAFMDCVSGERGPQRAHGCDLPSDASGLRSEATTWLIASGVFRIAESLGDQFDVLVRRSMTKGPRSRLESRRISQVLRVDLTTTYQQP